MRGVISRGAGGRRRLLLIGRYVYSILLFLTLCLSLAYLFLRSGALGEI